MSKIWLEGFQCYKFFHSSFNIWSLFRLPVYDMNEGRVAYICRAKLSPKFVMVLETLVMHVANSFALHAEPTVLIPDFFNELIKPIFLYKTCFSKHSTPKKLI